jgi:SAM-dependent methyltransferase
MTLQKKHHAYWNATWKKGLGATNVFAKKAALQLRPASRVLDLGCGTGKDSLYFARKGHDVTAMDFSESAMRALQDIARERKLDIRCINGDSTAPLPFADRTFDAVYAHLSLHYFDDATTAAVFKEVHRVLKPGGLFFVKCKSVDDVLYGKGKKIAEDMYVHDHIRRFFRKEFMVEMLKPFHILRVRRTTSRYRDYNSSFIEAIGRKQR